MDYDVVIFWWMVLSCVSGLVLILRRGRSARGWICVYLAIMVVSLVGWVSKKGAFLYAALAAWLLLVLCPALLSRLFLRRFLQQRYASARRLATILRWLHPTDGWRQQPAIIRALELAQQGELTAATDILTRFRDGKSLISLSAVMNLYRLTNQWEELLTWQTEHIQDLEPHPQFLPILLRTHGETADLRGMIQLYERNKHRIARLAPASSRDLCRLILFAFCGKTGLSERLLAGSLSLLPPPIRAFWRATATLASGASDLAKRQFDELLPAADPPLRRAIERRLSQLSLRPDPLDASAEQVIEEAAREHGHDESLGVQRSLFSSQARATQILITLNLAMFAAEIFCGGSTNLNALYRLGALFPPAVRAGEWWRLATSLFLHAGPLHLAMNMVALWWLGPFVEFALGFRRFLLVYFFAGLGSMGFVMLLASGPKADQLTVGASGCILGLIGATGALMLRIWLHEKALSARRRLGAMVLIVAMQSLFDIAVPQVSMTAHLSGVLLGFAVTLGLRHSLRPARVD